MNELPSWRALVARAWRVLRQRLTPLAPDCEDCGFPLERTVQKVTGYIFAHRKVYVWGNGNGRCAECAKLQFAVQCVAEEHHQREMLGRLQEVADAARRQRPRGCITTQQRFEHILPEGRRTPLLLTPLEMDTLMQDAVSCQPGSGIPVKSVNDVAFVPIANAQTDFERAWLAAHPPLYFTSTTTQ